MELPITEVSHPVERKVYVDAMRTSETEGAPLKHGTFNHGGIAPYERKDVRCCIAHFGDHAVLFYAPSHLFTKDLTLPLLFLLFQVL